MALDHKHGKTLHASTTQRGPWLWLQHWASAVTNTLTTHQSLPDTLRDIVILGHRFFQLCHDSKSSLDPDVHMGPTQWEQRENPASASTLTKSRRERMARQGGSLHHLGLAHPLNCWQIAGCWAAISPNHNITQGIRDKAQLRHPFYPRFHQQWEQTGRLGF